MNFHIFKIGGGAKIFLGLPSSEKKYLGCERPSQKYHANLGQHWPIISPSNEISYFPNKGGGRRIFLCSLKAEKNYLGYERPQTNYHAKFYPNEPIISPLMYVYMLQNFNLDFLIIAFLGTQFTTVPYSQELFLPHM